mgnify:FL=1
MIINQDDGTAYPFDVSGLSKEDQLRAVAGFDAIIKAGGDYSQAVAATQRFIDATLNPPAETPPQHDVQEEGQEETTINQRKPMNSRALIAAVSITSAILLASWAWRNFVPAETAPINPLVEIAQVRAQAAIELKEANDAEKAATARQRAAKARYDAAWKREACLIQGNCPAKK